jgi:hypothetical protein
LREEFVIKQQKNIILHYEAQFVPEAASGTSIQKKELVGGKKAMKRKNQIQMTGLREGALRIRETKWG